MDGCGSVIAVCATAGPGDGVSHSHHYKITVACYVKPQACFSGLRLENDIPRTNYYNLTSKRGK